MRQRKTTKTRSKHAKKSARMTPTQDYPLNKHEGQGSRSRSKNEQEGEGNRQNDQEAELRQDIDEQRDLPEQR